ncbi:coelenterazine h 2-monooxygenase-like [Amphiura filiformis]|uniref:coelenterazine h 2-monooxygenase-like n=1 Tax=Amphiura filiformis TaxID=82378 RepID=UPI003B20BB34
MAANRRMQLLLQHVQHPQVESGACVNLAPTSSSGVFSKAAEEWWSKCSQVRVLDLHMSYYDSDPQQTKPHTVIFLHGNPTSSFLWRNIIPHVAPVARCLAPDLIGQGRSAKRPNHSYRFVDHYKYLCDWIDTLNLTHKVSVVVHDWGSGLGFHWCHMHPDRVEAIVHMESLMRSSPGWDSWQPQARGLFESLRSDRGEQMVLENNFFVEKMLPGAIMRKLSEDEMNAYREAFRNPGEDRRPTLTWPREIPVEGDGPEDVIDIANAYFEWMCQNHIPKLYIDGQPGFFSSGLRKAAKFWPNQQVAKVKGLHFLQEDSPAEIGRAVRDFLSKVYAGD